MPRVRKSPQTAAGSPAYRLRSGAATQVWSSPGYPVPRFMGNDDENLQEAGPKDVPKGIEHIDDMKPADFMSFLEKYKDLPLHPKLEVSEKVDGSARMSFGVEGGRIWTKSKNGEKRLRHEDYPERPMFRALRHAHAALEMDQDRIAAAWPEGVDFMVAEVLYSRIPNAIEYGPNAIVVHGVHRGDGSQPDPKESEELVRRVTDAVGGSLHDRVEKWRFEFKRNVDPRDAWVDVTAEYDSLRDVWQELKSAGKRPPKEALEKFRTLQLAVKERLVQMLRGQSSAYGPEGGDVEGLVFRDLETGKLAKLVDRDHFTKLNRFLWRHRELLDRGAKGVDAWRHGVQSNLRMRVADRVLGHPTAKSPSFPRILRSFGETLDYPPEVDTPDKRLSFLLHRYIEKNGLLREGDPVVEFLRVLDQAETELAQVRGEWERERDEETEIRGKMVGRDPLIQARTDEAIEDAAARLGALRSTLEALGSLPEESRGVAIMKIFLGPGRLERVQGGARQEERIVREDHVKGVPDEYPANEAYAEVEKHWAKLAKNGFVPRDFVGAGSWGAAFRLRDGRILKVTSDDSEARAANHIKGKDAAHVGKIFDVFQFPQSTKKTKAPWRSMGTATWYGIVQEELHPLDSSEAKELDGAVATFRGVIHRVGLFDPWRVVKMKLLQLVPNDRDGAKAAFAVFEKYQVPQMIEDLKSMGVRDFYDFHSGNVMKKGENYAVIDLGQSLSPGAEPPMLESSWAGPASLSSGQVRVNPARVGSVVKRFKKLLAKHGLDPNEQLGYGSYGVAYGMSDGRVLKVTNDSTEARSSNVVKGKRFQHIVRIDDVFRFPDAKEGVWFGIVQERLEPLNPAEKREFNDALDMLPIDPKIWAGGWKGVAQAALKPWKGDPGQEDAVRRGLDVLESYDVPEMLQELRSAGIQFSDFHANNVMKRGEYFVVIDLGMSQSAGKIPDVLEHLKAALAEGPPPLPKFQPKAPPPLPASAVGAKVDDSPSSDLKISATPTAAQVWGVGPEESVQIVYIFRDLLQKRRGITVSPRPMALGRGDRGTAVDIGSGLVLKVTSDRAEALASNKVKEIGRLRHVARIDDVFKFGPGAKIPGMSMVREILSRGVYGIVQEKLEPLPHDLATLLWEADKEFEYRNALARSGYDWAMAWEAISDEQKRRISGLPVGSRKEELRKARELYDAVRRARIPEIFEELKAHGIKYADLHFGNIMLNSRNEPVAIDLGFSKVEGGREPEVLEATTEIPELGTEEEIPVLEAIREAVVRRLTEDRDIPTSIRGIPLRVELAPGDVRSGTSPEGERWEKEMRVFYGRIPGTVGEDDEEVDFYLKDKPDPETEMVVVVHQVKEDGSPDEDKVMLGYGDPDEAVEDYERHGPPWGLGSHHVITWPDFEEYLAKRRKGQLKEARMVLESRADRVGVTIGRFQPFHKGHAEIVRDLARRYTKVVVLVAGNRQDRRNPFSFDLRVDMMKRSLPDVAGKVEVFRAEAGGKGTGYVPGILSDIAINKRSAIDAETAFEILVGPDRVEDVQKQLEHARQWKAEGNQVWFDPDLAVVKGIPGLGDEEGEGRISGTRVREAILKGDEEAAKSMMDPHLQGDPAAWEELYARMREELGVKSESLVEDVGDIGEEAGALKILQKYSELLRNRKPHGIDVSNARPLGKGKKGVAFEVGGNRVLKVTTDEKEAMTSEQLSREGQSLRHVVRCFDVFKFPPFPGVNVTVYGILQERLTPLSESEKTDFDSLIGTTRDPGPLMQPDVRRHVWEGNFDQVLRAVRASIMRRSAAVFKGDEEDKLGFANTARADATPFANTAQAGERPPVRPGAPFAPTQAAEKGLFGKGDDALPRGTAPARKRANKTSDQQKLSGDVTRQFQQVETTLRKFQMDRIIPELRQLGIKFLDFHGENMMKRGSDYVINDLGLSESRGKEPPLLEILRRALLENPISTLGGASPTNGSAWSRPWGHLHDPDDEDDDGWWQRDLKRLKPHKVGESWTPWDEAARMLPWQGSGGRNEGPGEARLAEQLGFERSGGNRTHDLRDPGGRKWEVKELARDGTIKLTAAGKDRVLEFLRHAQEATAQLRRISEELGGDVPGPILEYLLEDAPLVSRGEVTRARAGRLAKACRFARYLIEEGRLLESVVTVRTPAGLVEHRVPDVVRLVRGALELGISPGSLGATPREESIARLSSPWFRDESLVREEWERVFRADEMFREADGGLIVAREDAGFCGIPRERLQEVLSLDRITKAEAKLRVGIPRPPDPPGTPAKGTKGRPGGRTSEGAGGASGRLP
jgi:cytidyltransferase-like protein